MRRAKIVSTLGPSTSTPDSIRELVAAGMDVARLNLSHGDYPVHEANYASVRAASDATGHAVGVLVDLQGPKIRTGRFADGPITLSPGDHFTITTRDVPGDHEVVGTTYPGLAGDVSAEAWVRPLLQEELVADAYGRALLSPGAKPPVAVQSKGRQVCTCYNVTEPAIVEALGSCMGDADERLAQLQGQLKCGTNCGSCVPELRKIIKLHPVPTPA